MKFDEKYNISPEFSELLEFKSQKDELKHDAKILMFRFLSEIERLFEDKILQKDFASAMNVSPSFVNQLFKGDKLANLITLAKLQKAFDVTFEVKALPNKIAYNFNPDYIEKESILDNGFLSHSSTPPAKFPVVFASNNKIYKPKLEEPQTT